MMFDIDDLVLYGPNGVCKIIDITVKKIGGVKVEYFVLKPMCSQSSTLFVPTGNQTLISKMRYILSSEEMNSVIENISSAPDWIDDKNDRFVKFKNIISGGNFESLVNLVRALKIHEKVQLKKGKHLHISDEKFLKEAERMVCDEVSLVLHIERSEVIPMLMSV